MKRVIRDNAFESNSSSMHTVTVRKNGRPSTYWISQEIEVRLGEYGWSGDPCDDFYSKLAYAMCMVLMTEYPNFEFWKEDFVVDQDLLEKLPGYQLLIKAIRKKGDCERIIIEKKYGSYYPYGYIDHQSCENYKCLKDFFDDWEIDAETYLFDDGVDVLILNDNG